MEKKELQYSKKVTIITFLDKHFSWLVMDKHGGEIQHSLNIHDI